MTVPLAADGAPAAHLGQGLGPQWCSPGPLVGLWKLADHESGIRCMLNLLQMPNLQLDPSVPDYVLIVAIVFMLLQLLKSLDREFLRCSFVQG